jgi:hypothetical protein
MAWIPQQHAAMSAASAFPADNRPGRLRVISLLIFFVFSIKFASVSGKKINITDPYM